MSKQILEVLKNKLRELSAYGELDAETKRNALKEELQFYVLNFIYHHPDYGNWIMYGGSALRVIHGLDRMSVDLDFEVDFKITEEFLKEFKKEIENYFLTNYNAEQDFLQIKIVNNRGLLLKFIVDDELSSGHHSNQIKLKVDLNNFVASGAITERRPINHDQLSFAILTYNMSNLMASKIAAVFLRGTRIVGSNRFAEKGRDIYDLLWYMNKKIIPDFDYLKAKGIDIKNSRELFDKITLKILNNEGTDKNLKDDLTPLFTDQIYIENWLKNWRKNYMNFLDDYKIRTVKELEKLVISEDFKTENFFFAYCYKTEENKIVRIIYNLTDYWIGDVLNVEANKELEEKTEFNGNTLTEGLKQFAALFYEKNRRYLKKNGYVFLGDMIDTKLIRKTADNLNPREQILLTKSALISCELDDLFK